MKAIVCYSGGESSAKVAVEAVKRYGRDNVILLNHDISSKVEHQDIKRFKREVADYLGIEITYANAPDFETMTPLAVARKLKAFGVQAGVTFCTNRLKTAPFHMWLLENYPATGCAPRSDVVILYGFDAPEQARIERREKNMKAMGYKTDYPLANWEKPIERIEDIGIARPSTYRIHKHANCIGCLKAGRQHWFCVYCTRPDIWDEALAAELEIGHSIIKGVYLVELEPKFQQMRFDLGICPDDKTNSATFWARVNRALPGEQDMLPCECAI